MHTMMTRPSGMKTPHISWEGAEVGLSKVFMLLTPNNPAKSPSGLIMDSWSF